MTTATQSASALVSFPFTTTQIRALLIDSQCWFVAKDVFSALSISWKGQQSITKIKAEWKGVTNLVTPLENQHGSQGEQTQELIIIAEPAVYKIAFRSDKPEAERFTDRVAEIVTTIRKTGSYVAPQAQPADRYINLGTHPDVQYFVQQIERRFWFGGSATFAVFDRLRKLGGYKTAAYPESQIPRALEEIKRLDARAEEFFRIKCKFEKAGVKWVFGSSTETFPDENLPVLTGSSLRLIG